MIQNKKGATYGIWLEALLISIFFVGVLVIIGNNINTINSDNKDLSFGLITNGTQTDLNNLQSSMEQDLNNGTTSISSFVGFFISTVPKMLLTINKMLLGFLTGSWINSLVDMLDLGDYAGLVITVFKSFYFFIIIFIIIKLMLRINA